MSRVGEAGKAGHAVVSRVTIHCLYTLEFMSMMPPAPRGPLDRYYATVLDQGNQHMRTLALETDLDDKCGFPPQGLHQAGKEVAA